MSAKVRNSTSPRQVTRLHRKTRIKRKLVRQKGKIARLVIYRSNTSLYAQVIDDGKAHTLANANTREKDFPKLKSKKGLEAAKVLGTLLAKRALEQKVDKVVFDRNGYNFHGRIKAVADGAREAGLKF